MADAAQIDLLRQGAEAWNAWRSQQATASIDLTNGALRGLDLAGADLAAADLREADLRGANLAGANLAGARLGKANLFKVRLDGADLTAADLRGAQFLSCPLLAVARNWKSARRDPDLACGAEIPSP